MKVELYTTTDNARTVNKTLNLDRTLDIVFRQTVDEQAPIIIMNKDNLANSNYIHIPDFKRYYFIDDVTNLTATLVKVQLTTDLLMTYQDIVLNSQVQIMATDKPSYLSASLPTQTTISKRVAKSDTTLKPANSLILTTVGGVSKQVIIWNIQ